MSRKSLFIPLLLLIWAFISIIWSENYWLALFRSFKVLEFFLLFIYIIQIVPPASTRGDSSTRGGLGTISRNSFFILSILGLIQSIIGIIQFFLQHSIGLFWLKESLISPEIPGVAKIILDGERYIRAYGLFPHPNILGGLLIFSIIITTYLIHVIPDLIRNPEILNQVQDDKIKRLKKFYLYSLGIQIIGLILTFSKSAILGLLIALVYLAYKKLFHVEQFKRRLLIVFTILALIVVVTKPDFYSFFQKSLTERLIGYEATYNLMFHACPVGQNCSTWNNSGHLRSGTILDNPIVGLGNGQFVLEMQKYILQKLETWQFQPVHNVFLLILSELGLFGLGLFLWFLWKLLTQNFPRLPARELFHACPPENCSTWNNFRRVEHFWEGGTFYFKSIFLAFIFIMLFDHYLWNIQQGQILLWLTFGLLVGDSKEYIDKV